MRNIVDLCEIGCKRTRSVMFARSYTTEYELKLFPVKNYTKYFLQMER